MSSMIIYFSDEEDKKISNFKQKWEISKYETVKRMIREFKEKSHG